MSGSIEDANEAGGVLVERSRALLRDSVARLDAGTQSRLTRARHAALQAAAGRSWAFTVRLWAPAAGVTAAVLCAAVLWLGRAPDAQPNLEELEVVAASDGASGDSIDMLQNDLDFYDFADKAGGSEPAA